MKALSSLSLLALLPVAATALADEAPLAPLVISASRLPETPGIDSSHVQIISAEDIQRSGARDVTTLLRQVAVIQLTDTVGDGGSGSIGMRGFGENGGQNSLLLLDGRRLNNDSDIAPPDLRHLSVDDIDHIEIINGSAGALYGAGAVGGIVNIVTRPISRQLSVGTSRGSHDHESYRLRAGARQGEMGVQLIAEKTTADNYRDRNELNRGFVQGRVSFDQERFGFFAEASRQNLEQNLAGSLSAAQVAQNRRQAQNPGDFSENHNDHYSFGTRFKLATDWRLTIDGNLRQDGAQGVLSFMQVRQGREQHSISPRVNGTVKFGGQQLQIVGGTDLDRADYFLASPFGVGSNSVDVDGHYLQLGWSPVAAWEVVAAGRHAELDNHLQDGFTYPAGVDIRDNVDVGSLAVHWRPAAAISTWLRADQNFRFANADEQTMIMFGAASPLKTQTGDSYEAGFRYQTAAWNGSLQAYRLQLENEISYDPILFANVNLDDTRRDGGTAQVEVRLGEQFRVGAQLAYVDAEFSAGPNEGKRVPFVARDSETLTLTWLSPWRLDATLEQQRLGRRHASGDYDNSNAQLPSLYVGNLAVTWNWKGLTASARVNNLFDKHYNSYATETFFGTTAYMPAPERNILFSMDYRFR